MASCAIVTGSNGGFGQAVVRKLLNMNYEVIATVREAQRANALIEQAEQLGKRDKLQIWTLDVTEPSHMEGLKQYVLKKAYTIDVLVNNAGYCQAGVVEEVTEHKWQEQFDVNVFGVVSLTKALLPIFRKQRFGRIINISSVSGRLGLPGMSPYAASKFALEGFSESLRYEMLPFDIHVSLIEPGSYKTNIWEKALKNAAEAPGDYENMIKNLQKEARQAAEQSPDPKGIGKTIETIMESREPKFRYPLGTSATLLHYLKPLVPQQLLDKMIVRRILR